MTGVRFVTLDPGHFHAALVHKEMYPGVDARLDVYAPTGPDLDAHLARLAAFNGRLDTPTSWDVRIHTSRDPLNHLLSERNAGSVVVLAGRNRPKIEAIRACLQAGMHVLVDKPWIIIPEDMQKLSEALSEARRRGLVAYDIMTEREEITSLLQRELASDPEIFGDPVPGSSQFPGVVMESVHYLRKHVAGTPLRRPSWFFDIAIHGEGLGDVGTHLVDLVPWILFPDQPIDHTREVEVTWATRWPTVLSREDFRSLTGENTFPEFLGPYLQADSLHYYGNTRVRYLLRDVHVRLDVLWDLEAPPGAGDLHLAIVRGSRSRLEIRQGVAEKYRPELYVIPNEMKETPQIQKSLIQRIEALEARFFGLAVEPQGQGYRVVIPERYRTGHEAHFAAVTRRFLDYLEKPSALPAWEDANMLAKYQVTTAGVALARLGGDS